MSAPFSARTALAVVVANMIGTGVFTSLGFQLLDIQSGFVVMMLWFVGGVTALCGALCYAELGAALPRSGGEYNFLSETYHPAVGFVSGWVSATIGFAAPTALAAITFGTYLASVFPWLSPRWLAASLIALLAAVHATTRRASGGTQRAFTYLKVALIAAFCVLGWTVTDAPQDIGFLPTAGDGAVIASSAFAVALIYVNYAYSGWNAATYVIDELDRPRETLSRVLVIGTVLVMALYLLLNYTFLYAAPIDALAGKLEVGYVAARFIFGETGAAIMGVVLALLLVSTVSAMTLAGPRVLFVIGQDFAILRFLARTNADGVPIAAILFQATLAVAFVLTATGFSRPFWCSRGSRLAPLRSPPSSACSCSVGGGRDSRGPTGCRCIPYPAPLAFVGLMGWTLTYILMQRPMEGLAGVGIVASGAVAFYVLSRRLSVREGPRQPAP